MKLAGSERRGQRVRTNTLTVHRLVLPLDKQHALRHQPKLVERLLASCPALKTLHGSATHMSIVGWRDNVLLVRVHGLFSWQWFLRVLCPWGLPCTESATPRGMHLDAHSTNGLATAVSSKADRTNAYTGCILC